MNDRDLLAAAASLASEDLGDLTVVRGGGNNRLYRVHGVRRSFALKRYANDAGDARDRFSREFAALSFLWRAGETHVPEPIGLDEERGLALYAWIDGDRVAQRTRSDVDALAAFAGRLHRLRDHTDAATLAPAREAVVSQAELVRQVAARIERLRPFAGEHGGLRTVLDDVSSLLERSGTDAQTLPRECLTLSPSDFGLHNALRTADGIVFLDFEYFGWDDPVKLVADVIWHPGMELDALERHRFVDAVAPGYERDPSFRARFERDAPLYGLRWALIVLNEFLPAIWQRRIDAGERAERSVVLERQLGKAVTFVARARSGLHLD